MKASFTAVINAEKECVQIRRRSAGESKCYTGSYYSQKYVDKLNIEKV